ncbi:hypothetical protein MTR67_045133 [Solanum verrucosum]|uniref:Uncharacterized protein n=1 Tax=Solanum verrucosum TaxID=315347 RepID=A0AAF0UUT0_SOLVR|nr:hypothetical protein MTR67_045133 [Solanum verrucosum]
MEMSPQAHLAFSSLPPGRQTPSGSLTRIGCSVFMN